MAGNRYEITASDGGKYEINAADDAEAMRLEGYINEQLKSGNTDPTKWKPDNAQVLPPRAPAADPEDALLSDIGTGVSEIGSGFAEGAANVLDHAADWTQRGLNTVGNAVGAGAIGDTLNSAWGGGKNDLAGQVSAPTDGLGFLRGVGRFGGEALATAPIGLLRGGALVQGAVGGALLSDSETAGGVAMDAVAGAAGARLGQAAFNGAARLAAPTLSPELTLLRDAGVKVTAGQRARAGEGFANKIAAAAEDRVSGLPGVGDAITRDRSVANQTFNTAAINRALEPIGESLPSGLPFGRRAIRHAGDTLGKAYDDVLPRITATGDQQFATDLTTIHSNVQTLDPAKARQFNATLSSLDRYWQPGNVLDGEAFKAIETRLGEKARRFSRSPDADQQELGDAFNSVLDAMRELAARQNPAEAARLRAINQGWKSLTQVERAGLTTKGEFGPAGYSQAVRSGSATTRNRGYARGTELNQDLSDAASDILPSEVPDSGTSGRWAMANLAGLAVGVAGMAPYAAAKGVNAAMLRRRGISPNLARLLEYGGRGAAIAAPAAIDTATN